MMTWGFQLKPPHQKEDEDQETDELEEEEPEACAEYASQEEEGSGRQRRRVLEAQVEIESNLLSNFYFFSKVETGRRQHGFQHGFQHPTKRRTRRTITRRTRRRRRRSTAGWMLRGGDGDTCGRRLPRRRLPGRSA
jgi:hypothetical protein